MSTESEGPHGDRQPAALKGGGGGDPPAGPGPGDLPLPNGLPPAAPGPGDLSLPNGLPPAGPCPGDLCLPNGLPPAAPGPGDLSLPNGLPEVLQDGSLCNGVVAEPGGAVLPDLIPSFPDPRRERPREDTADYRPGNPDLLWTESEVSCHARAEASDPGDDMEHYFNANSHMLRDLSLSDNDTNEVASPCRSGNCTCVLQYHISNHGNGTEPCGGEPRYEMWEELQQHVTPGDVMTSLPRQSSPALSSDDHGDFIEADIQRPLRSNSYASSRSSESKDSATSSYEELPTLTLQENGDPCDLSDNTGARLEERGETCDHICPSCNNLCQGQLFRKQNASFASVPTAASSRAELIASSNDVTSSRLQSEAGERGRRSTDGREADRPIAYVRPSILNPLTCQRPHYDPTGVKLLPSTTPNSESGSSYRTTNSMSVHSPNCSECSPFGGTPFLSPDKDSFDSEFDGADAPPRPPPPPHLPSEGIGARRKELAAGHHGYAVKRRSASASEAPTGSTGNHGNTTNVRCDCARRQSNPEATSGHQGSSRGQMDSDSVCDSNGESGDNDVIEPLPMMRNIFYFRGPTAADCRQEHDPHLHSNQSDDSDQERYPASPPGVSERTYSNPPPCPAGVAPGEEPLVPSRRGVRGVLMYFDYDNYPHPAGNNLNPTIEVSPSEQQSALFNVSRQTSTSNFDQDENSFQELAESECDCFSGSVTSQSDSPPAIPGRPDLIGAAAPGPQHYEPQHYECVNLPDGAVGAQAASMDRRIVDEADAYEEVRHYTSDWIKKVSKFVDKHYVKKLMNEGKLYEDVEDPETREEANKIRDRNNTVDKVLNQSDEDRNVLYSIFVRDYVLGNLRSIHRPVWYIPTPDERDIERVMLWTEYQAYVLQVKQLGKSACGATSVANALKVFEVYLDKEELCDSIVTNQRSENAPVGEYLLSRSIAGVTADCLIGCVDKVTKSGLYSRFFCTFPPRKIELRKWLGTWMKKGAVPILTLNLQRGVPPTYTVPDAWHHQMVYGVGPKGLYLTNPQEVIPERVIMEQLTSPSELMIKRRDVTSRWQEEADNLGTLLTQSDTRWRELNVIGQILNVMREERSQPRVPGCRPRLTGHVTIPAWYKPGITLIVQAESSEYYELQNEPELPELEEEVNGALGEQEG